jgi:hypothetical protein
MLFRHHVVNAKILTYFLCKQDYCLQMHLRSIGLGYSTLSDYW